MPEYHPYLTAAGTPAYCAANSWIAVADSGGIDRLLYVKKVVRLWISESGPSEKRGDNSIIRFEPETANTNGHNPCLLYIDGEPHPWYFPSGWDTVRTVSFDHHGGDDF